MIRTEAGMSVTRFTELVGMPRRTYQYQLAKYRAGSPPKGPWPAPVVDRIEPDVAKLAGEWPAWGHRKIWAMGRYDGHDFGSQSSVRRAMARRGLLQPLRYQAERRQLAKARRAVFTEPPTRRNRVASRLLRVRDRRRRDMAARRCHRLCHQDGPGMSGDRDTDRF